MLRTIAFLAPGRPVQTTIKYRKYAWKQYDLWFWNLFDNCCADVARSPGNLWRRSRKNWGVQATGEHLNGILSNYVLRGPAPHTREIMYVMLATMNNLWTHACTITRTGCECSDASVWVCVQTSQCTYNSDLPQQHMAKLHVLAHSCQHTLKCHSATYR